VTDIMERLRNANVRYAAETNEQAATRRNAAISDAAAEIERLREALTVIASYDDKGASARLANTGSYSAFDEPGSVEIARTALEAAKKEKRG